jgi:hypothetical protein
MGQPATKEKEQEEGEEAEEEEDPSPVDTKPECEESCKPRCVKQLLHYEVCVIIPPFPCLFLFLHLFLVVSLVCFFNSLCNCSSLL